jgi:AcrR family transcriptional regulator
LSTESRAKRRAPRRRLTADARRELIEQAATEVFAERGFHGASIEEIARRSGVSVPVIYDHFESKRELHRRLLERHFAELRVLWREHLASEDAPGERISGALDAWFQYVETHPYAWRMLFRDTTGDPDVEAIHREVAAESRARMLPLFAREPGVAQVAGSSDPEAIDLAWEVIRAVLQGLAVWWYEHPHVPRERIVATAMNALWLGFERAQQGDDWGGAHRS